MIGVSDQTLSNITETLSSLDVTFLIRSLYAQVGSKDEMFQTDSLVALQFQNELKNIFNNNSNIIKMRQIVKKDKLITGTNQQVRNIETWKMTKK